MSYAISTSATMPRLGPQPGSNHLRTAAEESVPAQLAQRALELPHATALRSGENRLTFAELDGRANQMAGYLRSRGVGPEVPVAICLNSSPEFVVAALGILKAGGAYVPLDPSYPAERLGFILEDCGAELAISCNGLLSPSQRCSIIDLGAGFSVPPQSGTDSPRPPSPDSLAYIIYTSGSTGTPKGVEITHANLCNLVEWHRRAFVITPKDRASQLASIGFDAAVWEIWPNLCCGASVDIAGEEIRHLPESLRDWLIQNEITVSFVPTPMAETMFDLAWPRAAKLRLMLTGGDALHRHPPAGLPFQVVNNYGPTECTVVATSGVLTPQSNGTAAPGIGSSILNTYFLIVDDNLRPLPAGEPGELLIGGAGVGRGYRSRPGLTGAKFIPDFTAAQAGGTLYRTGDRVRTLADGTLQFLGRIDDQIKIRGFRIEPNEIVRALHLHEGVQQSAVAARPVGDEKQLVAYVVPKPGAELSDSDLREHLSSKLPEFMVPALFVRLQALPLSPNQKVDLTALPMPDEANTIRDDTTEFSEPRTLIEQQLAETISELLGVAAVGQNDNFFMLGGHSLLGAQLIARIRDVFEVELSLRTLFDHPTVSELALEVEQHILAKIQS